MKSDLDNILQAVKVKNREDYEKIRAFAASWVRVQMRTFTSEDLKTAYLVGNEPPYQPNVYGSVMNHMSRDKLIYQHGYAPARLKRAHSRILTVWISHEYRIKQQHNRLSPLKNQTNLNFQ